MDAPLEDEIAVRRFVQVWQDQAPAQPWTPVTDYSFAARTVAEGRHPDLIIETFGRGPYLDWGCGPDAILVRLLRARGIMAYGVDPLLTNPWRCLQPPYDTHEEAWTGTFPIIICREVLEHVCIREIPPLIRRWARFAPQFIYVTTRFAANPFHLLTVEDHDGLDPTHITLLTKPFLHLLFVLEGYRRRPDLEAQLDWQQQGRCLVMERPA